jgi:transposase-like protein
VDKEGNTIEFMLSAKRDVSAAKRFFKKMMRADHRRLPFTMDMPVAAAQKSIEEGETLLLLHYPPHELSQVKQKRRLNSSLQSSQAGESRQCGTPLTEVFTGTDHQRLLPTKATRLNAIIFAVRNLIH